MTKCPHCGTMLQSEDWLTHAKTCRARLSWLLELELYDMATEQEKAELAAMRREGANG